MSEGKSKVGRWELVGEERDDARPGSQEMRKGTPKPNQGSLAMFDENGKREQIARNGVALRELWASLRFAVANATSME